MRRAIKHRTLPQRVALGAISGLAGTFLMQGMLTAAGKLTPEAMPPLNGDPGDFMARKAEAMLPPETRQAIPDPVHAAAAKSLHLGYGISSGALYGALRGGGHSPIVDGAALGLGVWAAGYLGWLPATGLMPPVTEQTPQQVGLPIATHAIFGIAVAALYDALVRA